MKIKKLIVGYNDTNCYLISSQNELAIIDPGAEADKILAEVKQSQAKVKYIINTHYHPDHTTANQEIKQATTAPILIHRSEKDYIDFPADRFLREGDIIEIGEIKLKVINTPGHSSGSICLLGDNFVFTGDTLFVDGPGRTDLAGGSEEAMQQSLIRLKAIIKPGTTAYPGHGEIYKFNL